MNQSLFAFQVEEFISLADCVLRAEMKTKHKYLEIAGATVPCKLFILPRYDSRYGQAILRWVSNSHSDRINLAIPRGVEPRTPLRQRGIIAVRPWDRNLMLAALVLTTFALAFRNGQADDQHFKPWRQLKCGMPPFSLYQASILPCIVGHAVQGASSSGRSLTQYLRGWSHSQPRRTDYILSIYSALNLVPHHRRVFNSGVLQPSVELGEPCFCRVSRTKT